MDRKDYIPILAVLVSSLVIGILAAPFRNQQQLLFVDRFTNLLLFVVVLLTLVPLLRASQHWGGRIGRNLQLIALGLLLFMFSIVPHIEWHVQGAPNPLGPSMLGLSSAWWAGFFHILTIVSWLIIIYGFYGFWAMSSPESTSIRGDIL